MKTKLNILSLLILLAFGGAVADFFINGLDDAQQGYAQGAAQGSANSLDLFTSFTDQEGSAKQQPPQYIHEVSLRHTDPNTFTDTIYNTLTDTYLPVQYNTLSIKAPQTQQQGWFSFLEGLAVCISCIAALMLLITFISLIVVIHKSIIFAWSNVFRLRLMGYCTLAIYLGNMIAHYIHNKEITALFSTPGYTIIKEQASYSLVFIGLGLVLMAEIFAIGLRLQEEQELTI